MDKELNIKGLNMHSLFRMIAAMLMLLISTSSYAVLEGKGTEADPFKIDEPSDLPALRDYIASNQGKYIYVVQKSDIDLKNLSAASGRPPLPLSSTNWNRNALRVPTTMTYFLGSYDGNGHTISNWSITKDKMMNPVSSKTYYISMFGRIGNATKNKSIIKDLNIDGFDIETQATSNGLNAVGVSFLASSVVNAEITNCHIKNSKIHGQGHFSFGAIASSNEGTITNCSVRNCSYDAENGAESVGSLCGVNSGTVKNCFAYKVSLNGNEYVGGLVGQQNGGVFENCGFNGQIGVADGFAINNSGGLCGKINKGSFINCFTVFDNGGKTWSSASVFGGFIGIVAEAAGITVQNCYSFPQILVNEDKSKRENVDFIVGRDMSKEDSKRFYESLYCHEDAFGAGFVPYLKNGVDFTEAYKNTHNLLVASTDFMRSGCLAEILSDYHQAKLEGKNQWREDVEFQNDTLPILRFMVDEAYDVEPFCHPGIFTLSHSESGTVSTIYGRLKYITEDQKSEDWRYGLEVKVGNEEWEPLPTVVKEKNGNIIDFHENVNFSKKQTTLYRAYTYNPTVQKGRKAYGKIDTICVGSSSGPEIIEGCDSVKYDGKWFFPKDNGSYTNSSNEEVEIKIGKNEVKWNSKLTGKCGENSVVVDGKTYEKSGVYEVASIKNETGCKTISYQEIKLYPTLTVKDSLKIFTLGEMSYTYTSKGGINPLTVSVGNEYVLTPKQLVVDEMGYFDNSSCDSAKIVVKYVIPIKITNTEDETWSCKPVVYNGVVYSKDTIVSDTVKKADTTVPGGMLYEIKNHHIKVSVPDTILERKIWCGEIEYKCPTGICTTTDPRSDTVITKSSIEGCLCPAKVTITNHLVGVSPTREENIVSCGPYIYTYRGKTDTLKVSGDYVKIRSGRNPGACDNDTLVTYHVTIGEAVSYNDTTIHGCGKVVFKTLMGDKIFTESQDFVDEITTDAGCNAKRTVHVYIHKTQDKSSIVPSTGCAPYTFTKLDGSTVVFEAGNHIVKDTIKSKDACGCDSIVKTTTLMVENPVTLKEIVVNECNVVTIEGVTCTVDTTFVIEKKNPDLFKTCRTQLQPYSVYIGAAQVETFHVDTCGVFEKGGKSLSTSGKIEISSPSGNGCDNKQIYDVRIIEPLKIDSTVYACENYVHKFYDGRQEMVIDDGTILVDKLQSKVCLCDSIIRTVKVFIGNDSHETLPTVNNCGPYPYVKKSNGQKILIETSQIVYDTLVNKYGCNIYYETEVNIIPVITKIETLDACKEYNSIVPVANFDNKPVQVKLNTPDIYSEELIFLKPNESHATCMDTTKLFLRVHGVGIINAEPVVECDSYTYTDFDGSVKEITESAVIVDTLKSTTCDCDSVIMTTNITINKSVPEALRETNNLRSCDSVVYMNSKGVEEVYKDDIQFLDTFQMKNTGCDSVVIVNITVPKSTGNVTILTACGDTTLYDEVNDDFPHHFTESGVWRQILSQNEVGCSNYTEWHVKIIPTPRDTSFETGCGELSFRGDTYTSENEKAASFSLVVNGSTKCDTIHNYVLTVYPKYNHTEEIESCDSVVRNGIVYRQSILFRDTLMSRNNCDSVINVNVIVNQSPNVRDYVFGCNEVKFIDEDYNGGLPVYVHHDSTIYVDKVTEKGCSYQLIQQVQVGHPSSSEEDVFECFDSQKGYATYRDLILTSDTIIYDTITSENKCGTVVANRVNLIMPVHDTIYVDSCLHITYEGVVYRDTAEVVRQSKTLEMGCDSFTHVMLNVNKCFPYPVLVNKYNWILVCNDNILDEDKFKLKSNVTYNWYKNERLMLSTPESYFTEDKELNGCYQVGIIVDGGAEYLSDIVCIDENHGYSITPQPNPVEKLQPVTIICDFPVEGVVGTDVEVFNMSADKVYASKATSNEIVIPGMTVSGYYFVRLTTVTGKVLTAKYMVK